MGNMFGGTEGIDDGKLAVERELILKDFKFHFQTLKDTTESISSATDYQFEMVQKFLEGNGETKHLKGASSDTSHERLNECENKCLAYIQDNICVQAAVLRNTVSHLEGIFHKISAYPVDEQSQSHVKPRQMKSQLLENTNQPRLKLINLRAEYEEAKHRIMDIEMKIVELCHNSHHINFDTSSRTYNRKADQITELMVKMSELKSDIRRKDREIEAMQRKLKCKTDEAARMKQDNIELKRQINHLSTDPHSEKRNAHDESIQSKLLEMENDKNREISDLQDTCKLTSLKKQSEIQKIEKTVCLYTHRKSELLSKVLVELKDMLAVTFQTQNMSLRITECENSSEIEPNKPILVLCINASRIGKDVSSALSGIQADSHVAVVVLHHNKIHALPSQSSERLLTAPEYKSLGSIVDMAFLSSRGIYICDMNNAALSAIVEFIKQRN